ncbi:U32 family peptidase C-terminal domain-containing protein, partial [Oleiphilus sp. HI0086]
KFWQQQGLTRVILSRELSLDEIAEIKQRVPEMEIEVFVHGALCIAYSGRCLLSGYMTHRDSNQGACTNSCRWKYQTHEAEQTDGGEIVPSQAVETYDPNVQTLSLSESSDVLEKVSPLYLLQEKGRPGEYMPAYEDEHGTYIMNSKDLRAVQHVQRLMDIGVESLKIEGRTKSYYYAARTAQVYRQAINDAAAGHEFNMALMDDLEGMANRGFTEGFYRRHVPDEYQNYETGNSTSTQQLFVADVLEGDLGTNRIKLEAKNKLSTGDQLTLLTPVGNISFTAAQLFNSKNGREIESALGSGYKVELEVPELSKLKLTHEALEKGLIVRNI